MSYFDQGDNPNVAASKAYVLTPMAGDVAAVQGLYGRPDVREGDTIYGHGSTAGGALDRIGRTDEAVTFTIVDTGGTDRLSFWRVSADQSIDLRPGRSSDVFGHRGSMTIEQDTVIEDAWTGPGDDAIRGNGADNDLRGGSGDDVIRGSSGDDELEGGRGRDRVLGGSGDDRLWGQEDDDTVKGGSGRDRLEGNSGRDKLVGGTGDDELRGGSGDDRLYAGDGDDELRGGSGEDRLKGGEGRDRLKGGNGRDYLEGGEGKDQLKGSDGADLFVFGRNFGRDTVRDFDGSEGDRMDLSGVSAIRSFGDLIEDHIRERGDRIVIRGGEDGAIKLKGVEVDDLLADHFLF